MVSAPSYASPFGPTTGAGLQRLIAATTISSPRRYPLKQAIPPAPQAPKKNRVAKSCAAVVSPLRFNLGSCNESYWLRFNHRVNPKNKAKANENASPKKSRRAVKRKAEECNLNCQVTTNNKK
mmetsp:Transcript_1703/g.2742  ORF Transcript_1703/g.2742 Transcript_1703/m.2742 type:complete len:123 (+) Transcript_1703:47-415(+)